MSASTCTRCMTGTLVCAGYTLVHAESLCANCISLRTLFPSSYGASPSEM